MPKPKKAHNNSGCFSNILQKFVCTGSLPTHPCPKDEICSPKKHIVHPSHNDSVVVDTSRVRAQAHQGSGTSTPGIVARLMGLDSLPKSTTYESLFRSKSLNSLHFRSDYDPARAAFHRRGRTTSASFHDQGRTLLATIDEKLESSSVKLKECKVGHEDLKQKKEIKREKAVVSNKENECRKMRNNNCGKSKKMCQERYYRGNCSKNKSRLKKSNVGSRGLGDNISSMEKCEMGRRQLGDGKTVLLKSRSQINEERKKKVGSPVSSKKKVAGHKQDLNIDQQLQNDVSMRSPISILDHQLEFDSPTTSDKSELNLGPKSSPRVKLFNDRPPADTHPNSNINDDHSVKNSGKPKLIKADTQAAESLVELLGKACALAEERMCEDVKGVTRKFELFKGYYVEGLCQDFSQEVLEFLLNELTYELVESPVSCST